MTKSELPIGFYRTKNDTELEVNFPQGRFKINGILCETKPNCIKITDAVTYSVPCTEILHYLTKNDNIIVSAHIVDYYNFILEQYTTFYQIDYSIRDNHNLTLKESTLLQSAKEYRSTIKPVFYYSHDEDTVFTFKNYDDNIDELDSLNK